jgi:hypothetical protein
MAWFTRLTRFADVHLVYAQEKDNSCGIACVMMTVFKINKLSLSTAVHAEKDVYKVYSKVSGSDYDGSGYSYANHLASTLNKLSVGTWTAKYVGPSNVAKTILDKVGTVSAVRGPTVFVKPIIVLLGWTDGGAHFVVVDTVRTAGGYKYATVCDPWDGHVHVTRLKKGKALSYTGAKIPLSWDLGGKRHKYTKPKTGETNGWVVYRKS